MSTKKKIGWNSLFCVPMETRDVKFHDLPIAMQIGIFFQYAIETGGSGDSVNTIFDQPESMDEFSEEIKFYFSEIRSFKIREQSAGENFEG